MDTFIEDSKRLLILQVRRLLPVPCYNTNDLVIVLDGSGSIGNSNFETAKRFVDKLAAAYNVQSSSRVSFITYSDTANSIISLTNTLTPDAMSSIILSAPYRASVTYTDLGIDAAVREFTLYPRTVPRNMVVLTDGISTDPAATLVPADTAINMGIRTFQVGIGNGVNQSELLNIANGNQNRVFNANTFDDLVKLLNPLSRALCKK